jgi:hypothetical protein
MFCRFRCSSDADVFVTSPTLQPLSLGTPAGHDVFPRALLDGPRLLPPVQHLRQVGTRLRRLLVRQHLHVGEGLLSQIQVLPAGMEAQSNHGEIGNRRRKVCQRTVAVRTSVGERLIASCTPSGLWLHVVYNHRLLQLTDACGISDCWRLKC